MFGLFEGVAPVTRSVSGVYLDLRPGSVKLGAP